MKDYANPILLLIIIALLSWKVSMGIETPGTVELWLLTLCVTGCIVNGLLAIARALASKKAVMGVVWSMVYLIFCSCSWVTFREEKDYRAEIAIYNELNTKWHSENCNPFSLKDEEACLDTISPSRLTIYSSAFSTAFHTMVISPSLMLYFNFSGASSMLTALTGGKKISSI